MSTKTSPDGTWLALDIGGANIKAAHGNGPCCSISFPLWKEPAALPRVLEQLFRRLPPFARVALTMTAELCDCFETKAEGVREVIQSTSAAASGRPLVVWCVDSCFRSVQEALSSPALVAAANWLALAEFAARLIPTQSGLLIDVGSTTTDVVPLSEGRARPQGRTDTARLASGEMIYAGVRRTPVCALATELPFRGVPTGLAAELFATTLDIYLTLGAIPPDPSDLSTSDGRPATPDAARARLARMVGADREDFTPDDVLAFSRAADSALLDRLEATALKACATGKFPPDGAIISGSGEFLALRLARRLLPPSAPIIGFGYVYGRDASLAACAFALLKLAQDLPAVPT
jgi:probable H4MPT-linked C1 transfer pathway protein